MGASSRRRRRAPATSSALVCRLVNAAITSARRSISDGDSSPASICIQRSAHGLSRVASSQPPSSQIHWKSSAMYGAMAVPYTTVIVTSPSLAGYVQRSFQFPRLMPSPARPIGGAPHASLIV